MKDVNLIRIGALLHNLEDESSFNFTLKKLIDFCFAESNLISLKVTEIIDFLNSEKGIHMLFSQSEILLCCKEFLDIYEIKGSKDNEKINISNEYLQKIIYNLQTIDLQKVINQFYEENLDIKIKSFFKKETVLEEIYIFLYNLLIESKVEFNRLFSIQKNEIINYINQKEYAEIINEFINWDNEIKNQILFSIYGAGIEFSILSMKKNLIDIENFKRKIIYLDTNILFRLLGLNGNEFKKRTEDCIKKMFDIGMTLKISFITKNEFDETIKQKINFVNENMQHSIGYTINKYLDFDCDEYSIYHFFLDWKKNKFGVKISSFIPYINALLNNIITSYKIDLETRFNKSLIKSTDIKDLTTEYVTLRNHVRKTDQGIENDVKNYLYILSLRDKININKADYFLLSTDYELISFDKKNVNNTNVVLHPARLLSIILKFFGRITSTELKSFIRMLKVDVKTEGKLLDTTKLIINDQLNFYESKPDLQKPYIEALLNSKIFTKLDLYDNIEKRQLINEIFEQVSKESLIKIKIIDQEKDKLINNQALELKKTKKQFRLFVKLILSIIIPIFVFFLLKYFFKDDLVDSLIILITISSFVISLISLFFNEKSD